ncbi:MAG: hypothetical protein RJB65_499 [Actinomycetota bacterium]
MCNETPRSDDQDVVSATNPSHDPLRALLESAVSPATAAELGDVEASVAAFRSVQATPASGTVQGSRAALMRRVPRRVVGVVVGTLLVAGTAAAAATDVLPSWVPVVGQSSTDESSAPLETDDTDDTSMTEETTLIDGTGTPSVVSVPEQSSRDWGWCTSWSKGGGDEPDEDGDGLTVAERLTVLADADGVTVEEYCAVVLATPPNEKDPGKGPDKDPVDPTETSVPQGNGNGNGNPGNAASNGNGANANGGNGKSADTTAP